MFGSDRSWDSDWCGIGSGRGRGEGFRDDGREGGHFIGELKEPVFEKSMAHKAHRGEARETGRGGVSGQGGPRVSDNRKKDAGSTGNKPATAGGNEDVDAMWHRGSGPRNF